MSENGGVIEYTVSADTADLLSAEKVADKFVSGLTSAMKQADAAVGKFKSSLSNMGRTVTSTNEVITAFGKVDKEATAQLKALTAQAKLTRYQSQGVGTAVTKTAAAVNAGTKSFKMMKGGGANLSYQLQDIIVQAQMGTNAFTILAQQGPQIFSIFGAAGAGLGVLIALLGALGPAVASAFGSGSKAAKEYENAVDKVNAVVTLSADGTATFTDQVQRLAKYSKSAAAQLLSLASANALIAQQKAAQELGDTFDSMGSSVYQFFDNTEGNITKLTHSLTGMKFTDGKGWVDGKKSVENFISALQKLKENQSTENMNDVLSALNKFKVNGKFATAEASNLASSVFKMMTAMLQGKDAVEALNKAQEQLSTGGTLAEIVPDKLPDQIGSMNDELAILKTRMTEGDDAADALKSKMEAIAASKGMSPEQIERNVIAWQSLANVLKQTNKTADELKTLEDEQKSLTTSLENLTLAQKQENAVAQLGTNATDEQIKKAKELVAQNEKLASVKRGSSVANSVTTSQTVTTKYQGDMADLDAWYAQNTDMHEKYVAAKSDLDAKYAQQYLQTQSVLSNTALTAVNALASGATTAFATIMSGSGSAEDAMKSLAQTIIESVLQSLIQTAVQYTILPALARAFGMAQAESSATAATASTAASATTAAASSAASAEAAAAAAPAAAATATWSFGTAAAIGAGALASIFLLSKTLSGNRRYGGTVSTGNAYQVNESGVPEVYSSGNSDYLMATSNAKVTPLSDYASGGSTANINVNNYASDTVSATVSQGSNGFDIDIVTKQVSSRLTSQVNKRQGSFYKSIKGASK